ncbi:MAG: FG-GAP-like repeat-containing protein [Planctomycetota bacterium]
MTAMSLGDLDRSESLVRRLLIEKPEDTELMLLAARVAMQRQDWQASSQRYAAFVSVTGPTSVSEEIAVESIQSQCMAGGIMEAIDALRDWPQASPRLIRLRAKLLMSIGDVEGARDEYRRLLLQDAISPKELLSLAGGLDRLPDDEVMVTTALKQHPNDRRPQLAEAVRRWQKQEPDEAIALLQTVIESQPRFEPALGLLAFLLADVDPSGLEQLVAEHGLKLGHPDYQFAAARLMSQRQQLSAAAICYSAAIEGQQGRLAAAGLAAVLGEMGRESLANTAAQRAERMASLQLTCRRFSVNGSRSQRDALEIADTLSQLGRLSESIAWVRWASTLTDDTPDDARKQMGQIVAAAQSEKLRNATPERFRNDVRQQLGENSLSAAMTSLNAARDLRDDQGAATPTDDSLPISSLRFRDEAVERGLKFAYQHAEPNEPLGRWLHHITGGGIAAIDFDLDADADLFTVRAGGHPSDRSEMQPDQLWWNREGSFSVVEPLAGIPFGSGYGQGVAVGDVNEDGWPDLLVGNIGPNQLLINNGDGTFRDATGSSGLVGDEWTSSVAIADVDGDGLSDLIEINYCGGNDVLSLPCRDEQGELTACIPGVFPGTMDRVWINQGDGTFASSDDWAQVQQAGRGLGVMVADLDGQPGVEVFISNDMTNNHLWQFRDGSWTESAMIRGLAYGNDGRPQACMGIALWQSAEGEPLSLFVTNYSNEHNALYRSQRDGIFRDQIRGSGMADASHPVLGFGTVIDDFDADGRPELFVANGLVNRNPDPGEAFKQPAQWFRWDGRTWQLDSISAADSVYLSRPHVGRSVVRGDFDRDGQLDLAVGHLGEPLALLMNRTRKSGGRSFRIRLVGKASARDAIGATVQLQTDQRALVRQRTAGDGYFATHESTIQIALRRDEVPKEVVVRWPTGVEQLYALEGAATDCLLVEGADRVW